ncbi:MAG: AI-2E family transporter [Acidobacteriota bacterium]
MTGPEPADPARGAAFLVRWPWEKLVMWGFFLGAVYALRHLFFIIFMTFVLSYIMRTVVVKLHAIVSPGTPRRWLDRAITLLCFTLLLTGCYAIGSFLGPQLVDQGQALFARVSAIQPEKELGNILTKTIGAYLFRREYGTAGDKRYDRALREWQEQGVRVRAYQDFPALQATIEGPFDAAVQEEEAQKAGDELGQGGAIDQELRSWFLMERAPAIFAKSRKKLIADWENRYRDFAKMLEGTPTLEALRQDPEFEKKRDEQILTGIFDDMWANAEPRGSTQKDWLAVRSRTLAATLKNKAGSPYADRFVEYYEKRRATDPASVPYAYEAYVELENAFAAGERAFTDVMKKLEPGSPAERLAQDREDFEAATARSLARTWTTGPAATQIRGILARQAETSFKGVGDWLAKSGRLVLTIPTQLLLSVLLSLFICLDLPRLAALIGRLERSRAQRFYREIAPGVMNLGRLIGKSFEAQAVFAVVTTLLTWLALHFLGVHNQALLAAIVFIGSFIPVAGAVLSSIPIAVMALVQPGGSLLLAFQCIAAILVIHFIGTSAIFPKILGDMLDLHPVIVLAVLAVGEHFFGVWGLLLAVPVTVYIIQYVILDERGESRASKIAAPSTSSAPASGDGKAVAAPLPKAKALDAAPDRP